MSAEYRMRSPEHAALQDSSVQPVAAPASPAPVAAVSPVQVSLPEAPTPSVDYTDRVASGLELISSMTDEQYAEYMTKTSEEDPAFYAVFAGAVAAQSEATNLLNASTTDEEKQEEVIEAPVVPVVAPADADKPAAAKSSKSKAKNTK